MTNTTHYNMTIAEGTDVVNPLTQIFPNFSIIDGAMFDNKQSGIGTASEVTTGSVHAIVRANPDSDVFRFTATSAWTAGDTMTLDGNSVVVHMTDGTVPATGAYIIGAEVLAIVNSGLVTLAISSNGGVTSFNTRTGNVMPEASDYSASDIDFDNTNTTLTSTDVQGAIEEVSSIKSDLTSINETGSTASQAISSGTYFYLNGTLVKAKTAIASGATFTENTNYEIVTAGGLNNLQSEIDNIDWYFMRSDVTTSGNYESYSLQGGRLFSEFDMLQFTFYLDNWIVGTAFVRRGEFINSTGLNIVGYYDISNPIEFTVKYESDTSFQAKHNTAQTGTKKMSIVGIKL